MMRIALYQPDIAGNTGTILRLAACLNIAVDIIEPCGFPFGDHSMRRAGMDYMDQVDYARHSSWDAFVDTSPRRLVLLTTKAETPYTGFRFKPDDVLLLGRESAGVPDHVHQAIPDRITIPMAGHARSLNVALAAAMVLGESLRQTGLMPE